MTLSPLPKRSPSGSPTCPSTGPLDADIVVVAESPADFEIREQTPLVGPSGKVFNLSLLKAGIPRDRVRIINVVPCKAPGNRFEAHDPRDLAWGVARLHAELEALAPPASGRRVVLLMGNNPLRHVLGLTSITKWRGSLWPPDEELTGDVYQDYWTRLGRMECVRDTLGLTSWAYLPTFHPAAVLRQYEWHIWLNNDMARAKAYVEGRDFERRRRRWVMEEPEETHRLVYDVILGKEKLVGIDTEIEPPVVSLVTRDEVHCFIYGPAYKEMLTDLMASKEVIKVAHNMGHDWRQFEKIFGIPVVPPYADSIAAAHIMEPSGIAAGDREKKAGEQQVGKSLSPHISSKFTGWPYHKWLSDLDYLAYCGMDSVVGYDAYVTQMEQMTETQRDLVEYDYRLFQVLFAMSSRGILVDVAARAKLIKELRERCDQIREEFEAEALEIIKEAGLRRVNKPHLYFRRRQCECCGGGSVARHACPSCAGLSDLRKPSLLQAYQLTVPIAKRPADWRKLKVKELKEAVLGECRACGGEGKVDEWLGFSLSSGDQIADLFYRALGVPARRFQGSETTRIEQMERLLDPGGYLDHMRAEADDRRATARRLLQQYSQWNRMNTDMETAARIKPDPVDGRVRCNFDLWYTPTHRVASREGLLDEGTNLQNIPKEARKLLIPGDGRVHLYPDYRQVEGRSMAVITKDPALLAEYRKPDADSHQLVADMVTAAGTPITRDQAKRTFFATCYGVEAEHLSSILGVTVYEAQAIINGILKAFPGVRRMRATVERQLRETRGVTTLTGWTRRWLGFVLHLKGNKAGQLRDKVLKEGLATEPQYMGARVLGEGLIQLDDAILNGDIPEGLLIPEAHIHDASLLSGDASRGRECILALEKYMTVKKWEMEFPVDASVGPNWYVASMSDKEKVEKGFGGWTREAVLANGIPS